MGKVTGGYCPIKEYCPSECKALLAYIVDKSYKMSDGEMTFDDAKKFCENHGTMTMPRTIFEWNYIKDRFDCDFDE